MHVWGKYNRQSLDHIEIGITITTFLGIIKTKCSSKDAKVGVAFKKQYGIIVINILA